MIDYLLNDSKEKAKIFSVAEYLAFLNENFKNLKAKIVGEVSEVNFGPTGHVYFYLKDEKNGSVIKCIIWRTRYNLFGVELKEGTKVVVGGAPNMHKTYGFGFIAETIEYFGEGMLKKEYEKLKKKLMGEGLFADERKRALPPYPQKIGVITSLAGAVMADFANNLGRFNFKVKMIDARVEGQDAVQDILAALRTFKKQEIEVLVVMRGGGSLESMMAFNNEVIVREVANFPVPVIMAIGHDKNVPLAALAADLAVSTPSIAATTLSNSWEKAVLFLEQRQKDIVRLFEEALERKQESIKEAVQKISGFRNFIFDLYKKAENSLELIKQKFASQLKERRIKMLNSEQKILANFKLNLAGLNQQLGYAVQVIRANDPKRQLKLGYSVVRKSGKIVRRINDVKKGEKIDISVVDGIIFSQVDKTQASANKKTRPAKK